MYNTLHNKKICIIGGSSGIGLAVAGQAHSLGARIIICSRNAVAKHQELAEEIGTDIETYYLDATSEKETALTLHKIGVIDHLVITIRPEITPAPFVATDIEQAKKAFEAKFWGSYQLIQQAHKHINSNGSIVMTSGIAGEKIYKNHSTMALINGATETLCRALAVELAPIRINVVSPGFVGPKPEEIEQYARQFPLKRVAMPKEVAESYIYLMTSTFITGTTVVVDGGARLI